MQDTWRKFPLVPETKRPAVQGWPTWEGEVTTEPYGIPTGARNCVWVLDLDEKNGKSGSQELNEACGANDFPETYSVRTPSGGWHLYFEWDPERPIRNRTNVLPGVDVRGEGGYVCAGGPYSVTDARQPIRAPEWLYQIVCRSEEVPTVADAIGPDHPDWQWRLDHAAAWLATVPPCIQGRGGDAQLAGVALRLMRTYELPTDTALVLLEPYNARCEPPWDASEIVRKLLWAAQKGTGPTGMLGREWHGGAPAGGGPDPKKVPGSWRRVADSGHQYSFDMSIQAAGGSGKTTPMAAQEVTASMTGAGANPDWCGVWQYNAFSEQIIAICPPLRLDAETVGGFTNADICNIRQWYACQKMGVSKTQVEDAIESAASVCRFHPVRDYLDALEESLDPKSAAEYFAGIAGRLWGAAPENDAVESELLKRQCVAACRRVRQPGVKADDMLILYGEQGVGKSRFLRKLFSDEFFLDHLPPLHDKDACAMLRGKWGLEIAELTGWSRAEENTRKAFLSRQEDRYRGAFERGTTTRKRQCVFFGSTNDDYILTDPTGARRYNVVRIVREIDVDAFDRDQLWAAANALERAGYPHFFPATDATLIARRREHYSEDPWDSRIEKYVAIQKGKGAKWVHDVNEILDQVFAIAAKDQTKEHQNRVRAALRRLCGQSVPRKANGSANGRTISAYLIPDSIDAIAPAGKVVPIAGR